MPRAAQVEYWTGHDGKTFIRFRARNGRVIKGSESPHGFSNDSNARRAARRQYGRDVKLVRVAAA